MSEVEPAGPGVELHAKWLQREPEMALALRFVPESHRAEFRRWGALLSELRAAAFELSDAQVIQAKASWWAEELVRLAGGSPLHPLCQSLPPGLPWEGLARALLVVASDDTRAVDADDAMARMCPLGEAIAAVEAAWFDSAHSGGHDAAAATVHLLSQRLLRGRSDEDAARMPMNLLARHGLTPVDLREARAEPAVADWAAGLLQRQPQPGLPGTLFRRLRTSLDREQLRYLQRRPGHVWRPGPGSVWRCWRLARQGA